MGVDTTGKMVMWSPLKLARIFEQKIKGGPFKFVNANGPHLNIVTEKGLRFQWDVSKRIESPFYEQENGFFLKNGVLFYRSPRKHFSKKFISSRSLLSWKDLRQVKYTGSVMWMEL